MYVGFTRNFGEKIYADLVSVWGKTFQNPDMYTRVFEFWGQASDRQRTCYVDRKLVNPKLRDIMRHDNHKSSVQDKLRDLLCALYFWGRPAFLGSRKFIVQLCRLCKVFLGRKRPGCSPVRLFRMAVAPRPAHTQMQAVSLIWFSFTVCKVSQHFFATATLRIATATLAWTLPETKCLESLP